MHKAKLFKKLSRDRVHCQLCSHFCLIEPGERGLCGVRQNQDGELYTLVYDRIAAVNMDPIEKKPLYHFLPGTQTFSLGTMGCNLSCSFCQNWSLSQPPREGRAIQGQVATPEQLVQAAVDHGAQSVAYTYSEPTIFFELMYDTAQRAKDKGLANIIVSNGFQGPKALDMQGPLIDAANIDLKCFSEKTYEDICGARLKPVLANLKRMKQKGWWLEVTTLLIPEMNDSDEEMREMARFIANELGKETPWHISRFHPDYRMHDRGPTRVERLELAHDLGRKAGLDYVYMGNVAGHDGNSTYCPNCGAMCVDRTGFTLASHTLKAGACGSCGHKLPGVGWEKLV